MHAQKNVRIDTHSTADVPESYLKARRNRAGDLRQNLSIPHPSSPALTAARLHRRD
jgi:hypothetical protein